MGDEFEKKIWDLHSDGKWNDIISLCVTEQNYDVYRLMWVCPSIQDLNWIKHLIIDCGLNGIISIGCGSGLLEWIIHKYTQCTVIGVEIDELWWKSRFSPMLYLDNVIFTDKTNALAINIPHDYGIMFCYFNNGQAFTDYINKYYGRIIMIIGPIEGQNRSTDPLPLDVIKLNNFGWKLMKMRKLDNDKDCIAAYTRF